MSDEQTDEQGFSTDEYDGISQSYIEGPDVISIPGIHFSNNIPGTSLLNILETNLSGMLRNDILNTQQTGNTTTEQTQMSEREDKEKKNDMNNISSHSVQYISNEKIVRDDVQMTAATSTIENENIVEYVKNEVQKDEAGHQQMLPLASNELANRIRAEERDKDFNNADHSNQQPDSLLPSNSGTVRYASASFPGKETNIAHTNEITANSNTDHMSGRRPSHQKHDYMPEPDRGYSNKSGIDYTLNKPPKSDRDGWYDSDGRSYHRYGTTDPPHNELVREMALDKQSRDRQRSGPCRQSMKSPSRGSTHTPQYIDRHGSHSSALSHLGSKSVSSPSSTHHKLHDITVESHNTSTLSEGPVCRICHEGDVMEVLVSPCYCAGSMGLLHISCLQRWLGSSNKTTCEICNFQFALERRPMPISQFVKNPGSERDRRNMVCDLLAFVLITPLTVLTTSFCIEGALEYYEQTQWERGGLIGLSISLLILYLVWLAVAIRHNWRLYKDWQMFHQDVTLICKPQMSQGTEHGSKLNVQPLQEQPGPCSIGSHSTVGSVKLHSIKISVQGSVVHYKRDHGKRPSAKLKNEKKKSKNKQSTSIPQDGARHTVGTSQTGEVSSQKNNIMGKKSRKQQLSLQKTECDQTERSSRRPTDTRHPDHLHTGHSDVRQVGNHVYERNDSPHKTSDAFERGQHISRRKSANRAAYFSEKAQEQFVGQGSVFPKREPELRERSLRQSNFIPESEQGSSMSDQVLSWTEMEQGSSHFDHNKGLYFSDIESQNNHQDHKRRNSISMYDSEPLQDGKPTQRHWNQMRNSYLQGGNPVTGIFSHGNSPVGLGHQDSVRYVGSYTRHWVNAECRGTDTEQGTASSEGTNHTHEDCACMMQETKI